MNMSTKFAVSARVAVSIVGNDTVILNLESVLQKE